MIKYVKIANAEGVVESIKDRETGGFIPMAVGNRHYRKYLEWVAEGNEAIEPQPGPDYDLVEDEWVEDAIKKNARELDEAKADIKSRDIQLFEMILAIWDVLKAKGLVTNADLDPELRAEAADWKQKLDRIKAS